jgi:glycine cleavage system T protein (aminomethyltransferase)
MLKKPPLYSYHLDKIKQCGGRMVPFAGWEMPVMYTTIMDEHFHTRQKAGLFDVSHMGQIKFYGKDKDKFLEYITPSHIQNINNNTGKVSLMLNESGGIKDDCIIFKKEKYNHMTINACNYNKDINWLTNKLFDFNSNNRHDIHIQVCDYLCMIALQGPLAAEILGQYVDDLHKLYYLQCIDTTIKGIEVQICRCGYTGEDGFEISVHKDNIQTLVALLMLNKNVKLIGLGARDTLRIEAGMCLYGHEINEDINPIEANVSWILSKFNTTYIGYDAIKKLKENPDLVTRKRVGLYTEEKKSSARENTKIVSLDGEEIGFVTSGCPSPTLGRNISQGYINKKFKFGDQVKLLIRNKQIDGEICKFPFVNLNYYKYR